MRPEPRILVFFHYYGLDEGYRDNLVFFLARAWDARLQFCVIDSGGLRVELPELDNLWRVTAPNRNNDYGGYAVALERYRDRLGDFDAFLFINSSVRGPFVARREWWRAFTDRLDDQTRLVGGSINVLDPQSPYAALYRARHPEHPQPYSHVQTTAYAMDRTALAMLLARGFWSRHDEMPKEEVICAYELGLSQHIKHAGWNLRCLLERYNAIDYRRPHADPNPTSAFGDPLFAGAYFGRTPTPQELAFVKTHRNVVGPERLRWLTLRALQQLPPGPMRSWPAARALRRRLAAQVLRMPARVARKLARAGLRRAAGRGRRPDGG